MIFFKKVKMEIIKNFLKKKFFYIFYKRVATVPNLFSHGKRHEHYHRPFDQ